MTGVLAHTLVWTGVLIAAVLLLRRPVARWFGPQVAYALWALPLLRLILPPIVLPAWMAPPGPVSVPVSVPESVPAAPLPAPDAATWQAAATNHPFASAPLEAVPPAAAGFDLFAAFAGWPLIEAGLLVWLGGAAVFLWRRFASYFALRNELLAQGREVGRIGGLLAPVRLVETPATVAPLAMGVLDPVIALPPGFMALHDRQARDLALAHELAHHRGGDLLVNVLMQPLFALHWFNPLNRYGWLALRRDQEAACDARVMARRDAAERAAYAALIARYATAPLAASTAALAAPMACPVLGEKSVIHRLRSLSMSDLSPRRRWAGRALLGAGLLILPLTASISYAASGAVLTAPEPPVPPAPPAPPTPPAPPPVGLDAPTPPEAPEPPEAPQAPTPPEAPVPPEPRTAFLFVEADDEHKVRIERRFGSSGQAMSRAEREEIVTALREGLAEADRELADLPRTLALALSEAEAARAAIPRVVVRRECRRGHDEPTSTSINNEGNMVVTICQSRIQASARKGLEQARDEIAKDKEIPEDTRKQMLFHLDRQIARWNEQDG